MHIFPHPDSDDWPESEDAILDVAEELIRMLRAHPDAFPNPPHSADELQAAVEGFRALQAESDQADSRMLHAYLAGQETLRTLRHEVTQHGADVEVNVLGHPERLSWQGWGGRAGAGEWEPPGAVRDFTVDSTASDWILKLTWRPPADGGPAATYVVQRRKPRGDWTNRYVDLPGNDCLLLNEPKGIELDYRVVAVNPAGEGEPGEVVTVVL